jgi:clan AA aspartic protease (TIGR02281 family)
LGINQEELLQLNVLAQTRFSALLFLLVLLTLVTSSSARCCNNDAAIASNNFSSISVNGFSSHNSNYNTRVIFSAQKIQQPEEQTEETVFYLGQYNTASEGLQAFGAPLFQLSGAAGRMKNIRRLQQDKTTFVSNSNASNAKRNNPEIFSQVAVPLKQSTNALLVDATVRHGNTQEQGAFILDTGATYTSISTRMAKNLGINLKNTEKIMITTANGRISVPKVLLKSLTVNGLHAYNIETTIIPISEESSFSGLLGLSFIRQFVMTIDTERKQLIFQPL